MLDLIVLGSITEDIIRIPNEDDKHFIGGVPVYAASTAKALGESIGVVSKVGTDFHLKNLKIINSLDADLNGFKIIGSTSMKFENKYNLKGKRTQRVLSVSDNISFNDIPEIYFDTYCIHLGPVFNEITPNLISEVGKVFDFVSLDGQGFTRSLDDKTRKVIHKPWLNYEEYLPLLDVLKVDDTELKGITATNELEDAIELALETGLKLLVITLAHKGAIIYHEKKRYDIPAIPTNVIDETGAGDTFITAFLLEYMKTKDCYYSGLMAAAAASFKISTSGPIPNYTREDILNKLKAFQPDFEEK
jgi:sugar/nucleoside kinase (ribokinase family)